MPENTPLAVIDANILFRAFLRSNGNDGKVFEAFKTGKIHFLYSESLIRELVRILNYPRIKNKYHVGSEEIRAFIDVITTFGKFVFSPKRVKICRDPDDDELISIALYAKSTKLVYIITGDKDLLELKGKIKGIKIVIAGEFLKTVL